MADVNLDLRVGCGGGLARVAWETRAVSSGAPRTVKAVDTPELVRLDAEAVECG